jgi:hypothetical protein
MELLPGQTYKTSNGNDVTYDEFLAYIENETLCTKIEINDDVYYKCNNGKFFKKEGDGKIIRLSKDNKEIKVAFSFKSKKSKAKKSKSKKSEGRVVVIGGKRYIVGEKKTKKSVKKSVKKSKSKKSVKKSVKKSY